MDLFTPVGDRSRVMLGIGTSKNENTTIIHIRNCFVLERTERSAAVACITDGIAFSGPSSSLLSAGLSIPQIVVGISVIPCEWLSSDQCTVYWFLISVCNLPCRSRKMLIMSMPYFSMKLIISAFSSLELPSILLPLLINLGLLTLDSCSLPFFFVALFGNFGHFWKYHSFLINSSSVNGGDAFTWRQSLVFDTFMTFLVLVVCLEDSLGRLAYFTCVCRSRVFSTIMSLSSKECKSSSEHVRSLPTQPR